MMKNILVVGGAGYVGTSLVDLLLEKNYKVTVYDLFIYGNHLIKNENLNIIKGDIRDILKLKKIIVNFDAVIHLAGLKSLNESVSRLFLYWWRGGRLELPTFGL